MLVNPRFGMRRCKGIWPPSNPRIMREPLRERWPLCPRVEVLPMPEPMPRPTRFLFSDAFFGARTFERFISCFSYCRDIACYVSAVEGKRDVASYVSTNSRIYDRHQMRHLRHHAANGPRVRTLNH